MVSLSFGWFFVLFGSLFLVPGLFKQVNSLYQIIQYFTNYRVCAVRIKVSAKESCSSIIFANLFSVSSNFLLYFFFLIWSGGRMWKGKRCLHKVLLMYSWWHSAKRKTTPHSSPIQAMWNSLAPFQQPLRRLWCWISQVWLWSHQHDTENKKLLQPEKIVFVCLSV